MGGGGGRREEGGCSLVSFVVVLFQKGLNAVSWLHIPRGIF